MAKVHGKNGLIYVSGTEIAYANAWDLTVDIDSAELAHFGSSWQEREAGINDWSGSITAWHDQDSKVLYDSAVAGEALALLIYPKRTDLTTYWSGDAIFSFGSSGDMGAGVGQTANFVGAASLTITGFS